MALTGDCQLCGAFGTIAHRRFECSAWSIERGHGLEPELLQWTKSLSAGAAEQLARGLISLPMGFMPRPVRDSEVTIAWWPDNLAEQDRWLTDLLFVDGSGIYQSTCHARAGWSIVQTNNAGERVRAAYGPVPWEQAPEQWARDGEDYSVFMATILARGEYTIYGDCAATLGIGAAGPPAGTAPREKRAHLWTKVWTRVERLNIIKTKAHATMEDCDKGLSTEWERRGNSWADHFAKLGAAMHPCSQQIQDQLEGFRAVQAAHLQWISLQEATMHDRPMKDYEELEFRDRPAACRPWLSNVVMDKYSKHVITHIRATAHECTFDDHRGHELWSARVEGLDSPYPVAVVMCSRCGAYAHEHVCDLAYTCIGRSSMSGTRLARWQRFLNGRFPKHGDERTLDSPTRCSAAAYAFLCKRWISKDRGRPGQVPDTGVEEWGSERWRACLAATLGAELRDLQMIGEARRAAKAQKQADKGAKRKALRMSAVNSDSGSD